MNQFTFNVYKQSRVLWCLFLSPFLFIGSILIASHFNSFFIAFLLFPIFLIVLYYYVVGRIVITVKDEKLNFEWKRKTLFNYKDIKVVNLEDIKVMVIDEGRLLKKIKTFDRVIYINNSKMGSRDAFDFITYLRKITKPYSPEIIDSWDEFARKGYLKLAYKLTNLVLFLSLIAILISILCNAFKVQFLFICLMFIPQMLLHRAQMKNKLKE
ncbi:hypothetical protein [Flavobacterium microcysteis]